MWKSSYFNTQIFNLCRHVDNTLTIIIIGINLPTILFLVESNRFQADPVLLRVSLRRRRNWISSRCRPMSLPAESLIADTAMTPPPRTQLQVQQDKTNNSRSPIKVESGWSATTNTTDAISTERRRNWFPVDLLPPSIHTVRSRSPLQHFPVDWPLCVHAISICRPFSDSVHLPNCSQKFVQPSFTCFRCHHVAHRFTYVWCVAFTCATLYLCIAIVC